MEKSAKLELLQSQSVNCLRIVLIFFVLFLHYPQNNLYQNLLNIYIDNTFNDVIKTTIITLAEQAVPVFFFLSGYFFFWKKENIGNTFFLIQIKKRVRTLLVPYLIWNTLYWLLPLIIKFVQCCISKNHSFIELTYIFHLYCGKGFFFLYCVGPALTPLWFVRSLLELVIFTPILYYLIKKLKYFFLLVIFFLSVCDFLDSRFVLIGFNVIMYYSLGILFALNKENIVSFSLRNKYIILFISLLTYILTLFTYGLNDLLFRVIIQIFTMSCFFSYLLIMVEICKRFDKIKRILVYLSTYTFFIYCCHSLCLVKYTCLDLGYMLSNIIFRYIHSELLLFFSAPLFCFFLCILLAVIIKYANEKIYKLLSGAR